MLIVLISCEFHAQRQQAAEAAARAREREIETAMNYITSACLKGEVTQNLICILFCILYRPI